MEKNQLGVVIAIAAVVVVLFGISFYISQNGTRQGEGFVIDEGADIEIDTPRETITAKHQYKDGTHIIAGEIGLPTPCHILEWSVDVAKSLPEQVTINLLSSTQAEVCAQVITPARFKIEFQVSANAPITMTLNGEPVVLNLIETGPNEDLEDFELFIKG